MTSIIHPARKALVALASTLAFASAAPALEGSAADGAAAGALAPMLELDEIWVHGKRLATRIEEAEDDFFGLYNSLNDDDRFDVVCGLTSLQPGSMILERTCVPGFLAGYAHASQTRVIHYQPPARVEPATCHGPATVDNGAVHFEGGCFGQPWDTAGMSPSRSQPFYPATFGYASLVANQWVPAELLALHHRDEYADTVRTAIAEHPELADKAANLASLYGELESTRQQYRDAKAATPLAWSFERRKGAPGPRGR